MCRPDYLATKEIGQELVVINMLVDYPLVLGFCVPVLVPLACLSMVQSAAVLHWAPILGVEFSNMARPSSAYMWLSGCAGLAFSAWFYVACGLHGKYIVAIVAPLMTGCSAWCSYRWCKMAGGHADDPHSPVHIDLMQLSSTSDDDCSRYELME